MKLSKDSSTYTPLKLSHLLDPPRYSILYSRKNFGFTVRNPPFFTTVPRVLYVAVVIRVFEFLPIQSKASLGRVPYKRTKVRCDHRSPAIPLRTRGFES